MLVRTGLGVGDKSDTLNGLSLSARLFPSTLPSLGRLWVVSRLMCGAGGLAFLPRFGGVFGLFTGITLEMGSIVAWKWAAVLWELGARDGGVAGGM